ncbi:MAG: RidA family protein [Chloroflexota bacterium]|jgi:enamine deaminase RidA (YjgF/YER057c/UK114 family)|nr:RidA family protein [Chloroflexota bacterium]|tara:strand:+ start:5751 stop:6209 length:459 start_codon:yes stop_codon:yes gene_type:complete
MSIDNKLKELGITLKSPPSPVANYIPVQQTGNLIYLSGQGPRNENGEFITGKVGSDITAEEAYDLARNTAINLLSAMNAYLGSLDRVSKIVKVLGMVNAEPDFKDHPIVINGCSDLFVEVFGEKGRHARSAVGMGSLPNNMAVEIEIIVEIE